MSSFKFIANVVKDLRHVNSMTQMELSRAMGFKNGQFISNIERGICSIPYSKIVLLSQILKVDQTAIIETILEDCRASMIQVCGVVEDPIEVKEIEVRSLTLKEVASETPHFRQYM